MWTFKAACIWLYLPIFIVFGLVIYFTEVHPETITTFQEQCELYNYTSEEYKVFTDDGYILTLFRIPGKGKSVLLMHGLVNSANTFVLNQCGPSPAFLLSDAGYDVWLGNFRGSHLSRKHITLDESSDEYWDWSFVEMFMYDLKAFAHFIFHFTPKGKIGVIGHSLGGGVILNGLALNPEILHNYIEIGVTLGSPGGIITPESYYIQFVSSRYFHFFCRILGIQVVLDYSENTLMAKFILNFPNISKYFTKDIMDLDINGGKPEDLAIFSHKAKGGTSVKSLEYLGQYIGNRLSKPKLFDYGPEKNFEKYGDYEPPRVDFQNIIAKIAIFNVKNDRVVSAADSLALKAEIPSEKLVYYRDDIEVDHGGLIFACNMSYFLEVLEVLSMHL